MDVQNEIISFIEKNYIFNNISKENQIILSKMGKILAFPEGDYIIHENDEPDQFYLIIEGLVDVTKIDPDKNIEYIINSLKPGDVFGEIGFVTKNPRTANVKSKTNIKVLAFNFEEVHKKNNEINVALHERIVDILAQRLDHANNVTLRSMQRSLQKSKRIAILELVIIIIMTFSLLQIGMAAFYIFHSDDLCNIKYPHNLIKTNVRL